jgi:hypothetical protein
LVERFVRNEEARGSNPLTSTIPPMAGSRRKPGDEELQFDCVARERLPLKREADLAERFRRKCNPLTSTIPVMGRKLERLRVVGLELLWITGVARR